MPLKYLLDTNICVAVLRKNEDVKRRLLEVGIGSCAISDITVAELLYGAHCSAKPTENIEMVNRFCNNLTVLPIRECLNVYAATKSALRQQGKLIEDFDLLIGSAAKAHGLILVTDNTKHMARIGVRMENWINR